MKRRIGDFGRRRAALCVGLALFFLAPPSVAIADDPPRRSGPPPLVMTAFPNECARCHKADGRGGAAYGGFAADLRETFLDHEGLVQIITIGIRDRGMPEFQGVFSKRQIDAVATYIIENFKGQPVEGDEAVEQDQAAEAE